MQATIVGENEDGIGVDIVDNNGSTHEITFEKPSYELVYHQCEDYPDKTADRTPEGNEHNLQARRYAKWHVYRERGYDTVAVTENPDRILAALAAISQLSAEAFEDHFGDLIQQVRSHYDSTAVEVPFEGVDPSEIIVYQKDVYVKPDPTTFDPPVLDQVLGRLSDESDAVATISTEMAGFSEHQPLDFEIEAISELQYLHNDGYGNEQVERAAAPLDREPDARIELMPVDPDDFESFQQYVVSHLAFQIRDCYLRMGVKPPVAFRKPGWGKYRAFVTQKFCPLYENYWNANEPVTSWDPGSLK